MTYDFRKQQGTPAFEAFIAWYKNDFFDSDTMDYEVDPNGELYFIRQNEIEHDLYNPLDLFEFFDSVGIHGGIHVYSNATKERSVFQWDTYVLQDDERDFGITPEYTRPAATVACIDRMFQILNERLKDEAKTD